MTGKFSAYAIALACVTGAAPALAQEGIVTGADRQADQEPHRGKPHDVTPAD